MLDQMIGGRLELGVGRGISPHEVAYYAVDPAKAQAIYIEALAIIRAGLTQKTVSFAGEFFTFKDVPIELEPVQRPHPPLWYGMARPEGVGWAVANRVNIVCNGPPALVGQVTDRYRQEWGEAGHHAEELPLMGMTRTLILGALRGRGARDRAARSSALVSELHAALGEARHAADQRLLSRQFRTRRNSADLPSPARRAWCTTPCCDSSRRRGSTISSAASPSAT